MLDILRSWFGKNSAKDDGFHKAEKHFQHLVSGVQDYAVFLLDPEGHVQSWNAGAQRIKGYRAEEIIGQHFSRFYPEDAIARHWPQTELREAAKTGHFEDEGWRVRKDGSRFWASVVITALRDANGEVRAFLKITRDLTERKEAEERFRLSEERFRLLVEEVEEYAIFLLDREGHVVTWNTGAERIKGYRAEEIVGRHFSVFYPPEDVQSGKPERELQIAKATGKYEEEGWRLRKDGSRFWASVVLAALRDPTGNLRGFSKITRDLTARKQSEENAQRLLVEEASRKAAEEGKLEAQRAQREERRHREQLRVTLASIGDAVLVTDQNGIVTFLNAVAAALTGWSEQEAEGQPLDRVFPIINQESRETVESPVTKALREGTIVGLANHTILTRRDGREFAIDDSAAPIRYEDGAIGGVVLVFRDVTGKRREAETRIRLAAIVESSDDAIISTSLDGIIDSWNHAAERLYGYTAKEALGRRLSIVVPPDVAGELPDLMRRLERGERIEHHETVRQRKDGSRVQVSLTISPVHDEDGKVIGASKIARDITARKQEEAALRFLAEASKVLAEVLDVPTTLQKVAGLAVPHFADWCTVDLLDANGSLQRLAIAHVDPDKVKLAQDLYHRFPPDPNRPAGAWHVLRTGQSVLAEDIPDARLAELFREPELLRALRELGLHSYMSVRLTVRGKPLGVLSFVIAESAKRYGPADLRVAEDLAYRAAIAIDNAQLYSDLKDTDRRKDEFLAMLAHELRNPLAPIRTALHLMKMPAADSQTIENARQMTERQVQQMVRLVDDLLDVSRIMRGKIDLRKEPIDLATVITSAMETAQSILDARGQQLLVSLPPEPMLLDADATRLTQVIANLLHNAAKFSERAGRIWLTAQREGPDLVVCVRDEGSGIRADLLPHIFDLFVQGDQSLARTPGGLGIGLTVARRLVELHGGKITAQSEGPGRGSEFSIRLPALVATAREHSGASASRLAQPAIRRRVLVVDDNVDGAESVAMLLRLWGHDVHLAYNGPESLSAARELNPDVMLIDIGLPGMSGYDVAKHLRQNPQFQKTLLVAITGYGQTDDVRRSADSGFDFHLTKPVDPEDLERVLAQN